MGKGLKTFKKSEVGSFSPKGKDGAHIGLCGPSSNIEAIL